MLRTFVLLLASVLPLHALSADDATRTRVVVLGVDHAVQLVAAQDSPAHLEAFLASTGADAICIERSPEAFARNDFYEFTYEVQDVVVPYARRQGIALCPIDWMPPQEDALLGFGLDLEQPPELRPQAGFQQFLTFGPQALGRTLFHADERANLARVHAWATTPATDAQHDLPRRLYLYRTFLQARRVAAAAKAHPGGTVVVVVGEFHKHDIEDVLARDPALAIVQPSHFGVPDARALQAHDRHAYRVAIASFNLLGAQSSTDAVDLAFVERAVQAMEAEGDTPEVRLFRTRLELRQGRIDRRAAIARYRAIADAAGDARFAWTGVKDAARVDSWFDPYGNLGVRQRAHLEAAREARAEGDERLSALMLTRAGEGLSPRQRAQLTGYWQRAAK